MMDLVVTDAAARELRRIVQEQKAHGVYLRIVPSGCAGWEYKLEAVDAPLEDAHRIEGEGFVLYIDRSSYERALKGLVLDYHEDLLSRGFVYRNPNAKGGCGCGKSFALAE